MTNNYTIAVVMELPNCDFCLRAGKGTEPALYDFSSRLGWGFGCEAHYRKYRLHTELGMGKGQKLKVYEG